jgi:hypothetical protein
MREATSKARRVLPTPPAPVNVTSRCVRSAAVSSATSNHTRDGTWIRGEIRDLSPSGFCARLLWGDTARIEAEHG